MSISYSKDNLFLIVAILANRLGEIRISGKDIEGGPCEIETYRDINRDEIVIKPTTKRPIKKEQPPMTTKKISRYEAVFAEMEEGEDDDR